MTNFAKSWLALAHPLAARPVRVVGIAALLLLLPYAHPRGKAFRVIHAPWEKAEDTVELSSSKVVAEPVASVGELGIGATENKGSVTNALPEDRAQSEDAAKEAREKAGITAKTEIEDPDGALFPFFARLAVTEDAKKHPGPGSAGAVTRIVHYGDSVLTSDLISGTARRRFQERYGDSGHGFVLTANAWDWYFHNDVFHTASDGWSMQRIVGPWADDGRYGPGGVSFTATAGARATFGTAQKGEYGRNVGRFDIYYLEQPIGGELESVVEGGETARWTTRGPAKVTRVHSVRVADGAAKMQLFARGKARVFGVALERDQAGVVYDAMGINGARAALLGDQMNGDHWREIMDLRDPGLVILNFGTNESEAGVLDPHYDDQLGKLIEKAKAAAPNASVLVMSPIDRASKASGGELKTRKVILDLVEAQRRLAHLHHVAFFDMFEAMGGKGSMARWLKLSPPLGTADMTHPTPAGGEVLGNILFAALERARERATESEGARK